MNESNVAVLQKQLDELNGFCLKNFTELKDALLPRAYLYFDGISAQKTVRVYLYKKITVYPTCTGGNVSVLLDGNAFMTCVAGSSGGQNFSLERGEHTLTLVPNGASTVKIIIKGGYISDSL